MKALSIEHAPMSEAQKKTTTHISGETGDSLGGVRDAPVVYHQTLIMPDGRIIESPDLWIAPPKTEDVSRGTKTKEVIGKITFDLKKKEWYKYLTAVDAVGPFSKTEECLEHFPTSIRNGMIYGCWDTGSKYLEDFRENEGI